MNIIICSIFFIAFAALLVVGLKNPSTIIKKNVNRPRLRIGLVFGAFALVFLIITCVQFFSSIQSPEVDETINNTNDIDIAKYFPQNISQLEYKTYGDKRDLGYTTIDDYVKVSESEYEVTETTQALNFQFVKVKKIEDNSIIDYGSAFSKDTRTIELASQWNDEDGNYQITKTELKVTTPAGEFGDCIEVTGNINISDLPNSLKYFAPGIGCVATYMQDKSNSDVKLFSQLINIVHSNN